MAFYHTVAYKVDHNSGLERAEQKIETCGPAPIVVKIIRTDLIHGLIAF